MYPTKTGFLGMLAVTLILACCGQAKAVDISGTYNTATTFTDGDTWTAGDVTVNAVTVTNPLGSTLTFDSAANRNFNGDGTFRNEGTFLHDTATSGDNIYAPGANRFENVGTYQFDSGGDIWLNHASAVFENTGLIYKSTGSVGGSNDPSYILTSTNSTFINSGDMTVDAGHLNIAFGASTGGTFTTNGSGILSFSGKWTELTGTAVGTNVRLDGQDPASTTGGNFTAGAAITVIDIDGDGLAWTAGGLNPNNNLIQNDGLFRIQYTSTKTLVGNGNFRNVGGTLDIRSSTVTFSPTGSAEIQNDGTLTFTESGTKSFLGTGTLRNRTGGTADWQAGTISLDTGVTLRNEGTFDLSTSATKTLSGAGSLINEATGLMTWSAGTLNLTDNTLQNDGTFQFAGTTVRNLAGTGTFTNNGTFEHVNTSTEDNIEASTSGGQFLNNGTFDFQSGGDFGMVDGYTFTVAPGGVLLKSVSGGDASLFFTRAATGTGGTFDNQGTVEVTEGELEFRGSDDAGFDQIDIVQYDSGTRTLTGGTWIVRASSRLDMHPASAGIVKIGTDATVELTGGSSYFSQLTSYLNEVAGTLTINTRTFTAPGSGALTISGGTVDGSGTVTLGDTLTVTGDSTIGVTTFNLGGTGSNADTLNWDGVNLNLGAHDFTNNGTFRFTGNTDKNLIGTGTFINNGIYQHAPTGSTDNITGATSGGSFVNYGLHDIQGIGDFQLTNGYTYVNTPGGVIRKSAGTGNEALFFAFGNPGGTFDNQGTVEVLMDLLEIRSGPGWGTITVPQYDSGTNTLTGGTWIVRDWDGAGGGDSTLDLQPANDGIQTLGAGAAVELTGPHSVFTQLTSHLTSVAGMLEVNDRTFTIPGAGTLTLDGGTLAGTGTFAGDTLAQTGSIITPGADVGNQTGALSFDGDVTMQFGSILSIDLDGSSDYDQMLFADGGTFTLDNATLDLDENFFVAVGNSFVIVDGFDTLAGAGTFDGLAHGDFVGPGSTLSIFYNAHDITLTSVPEPSTLALALLGLLVATRFRRRRAR